MHLRRLAAGQPPGSAAEDRTIRIWAAERDIACLLSAARDRIFRSLTPEERRAHLLSEPTSALTNAGLPATTTTT
ncbi:hypothetical protein ABZZ74_09275 [Streptomyces sp. NPDC006476]|uniref:hypothetical protein n=1 Tax=Streptomyces sp. NPDC006476 TaxID=3157175 RepID=UPI0033A41FBC